MRTLEKMHPAVCFLYLLAVLGFTAFAREPVTVLISLGGSVLLAALSGGLKGAGWFGAVAVTGALANFLFVHNGETALFFVGDRAFTLEALCYGAFVGGMLAAVCLWGACAVRFVTSDKYIWLLGRIFPAAGLVLSCAIRFLPMFIRTSREFAAVQNAQTLRGRLRAFSASVGYSAERAMDSALSMKARGYGTSPRTSFSIYGIHCGFHGGSACRCRNFACPQSRRRRGILLLSRAFGYSVRRGGYRDVLRVCGAVPAALRSDIIQKYSLECPE